MDKIEKRCLTDSISNIEIIKGEADGPLFPENSLDMVIMMMAFHNFSGPVAWLKNLAPSLKRIAPLVIVDRDPDKYGGGYNHFMTKEKLLAIVALSNFELEKIETFLERDNIYIFTLDTFAE